MIHEIFRQILVSGTFYVKRWDGTEDIFREFYMMTDYRK